MLIAVIGLWAICVQPLRAQPQRSNDDQLILRGEIGFQGSVVSARWNPIWLTISSGSRAVGGVLRVEHNDAAGLRVRTQVPFATTPGRETWVNALVCLPPGCERVSVVALVGGRQRARFEFDVLPNQTDLANGSAARMTPSTRPFPGVGLVLGSQPLLDALVRRWRAAAAESTEQGAISHAQLAGSMVWQSLDVDRLPRTTMGLDAVDIIVTDTATLASADDRARAAVQSWVHAGGVLVVVASEPSVPWDRLGLSDAVTTAQAREAGAIVDLGVADRPRSDGSSAPARAFEMGGRADARTRIEVQPSPATRAAEKSGPGLLVSCRVGIGTLVLVGASPGLAPERQSVLDPSVLDWQNVLAPALDVLAERSRLDGALNDPGTAWPPAFALDNLLIAPVLGFLRIEPALPSTVLYVLLAFPLLLTVLLGPVDWIVLGKRRSREWSWLMATIWLTLAMVLAFVVPRLIRTHPSQVRELTLVESTSTTASDPAQPRQATVLRAVSAYANRSERIATGHPRADACVSLPFIESDGQLVDAGTWWQRLVAPDWWRAVQAGRPGRDLVSTPLVMAQVPGMWAGPVGGSMLESITLGQWTSAVVHGRGIGATSVSARVEPQPGGEWRVVVHGLPDDTPPIHAALRVNAELVVLLRASDDRTLEPGQRLFVHERDMTSRTSAMRSSQGLDPTALSFNWSWAGGTEIRSHVGYSADGVLSAAMEASESLRLVGGSRVRAIAADALVANSEAFVLWLAWSDQGDIDGRAHESWIVHRMTVPVMNKNAANPTAGGTPAP